MQRRVLDSIGLLAAASLAAGLCWSGRASASVEVRGTIEGLPDDRSVEVSLTRAPSLHELLSAVLAGEPIGFGAAQATASTSQGRFAFSLAEPGTSMIAVRGAGSPRAWLLLGPATDTLLPPLRLQRTVSCSLTLAAPGSAWVATGRSLRGLGPSSSWSTWPPVRRLEAGEATRYEFEGDRMRRSVSGTSRDFASLTVGAPGYEPEVVECVAGARTTVRLERSVAPVVEGVLKRDGVPVTGAILVRADGWPAGRTDELGRYRAPEGAYEALSGDGGFDGVELRGGVAELPAVAPHSVAVAFPGVDPDRDEMPAVALVHWSSTGAPLAFDGGRPENVSFLVAARPGVARTTLFAEGFVPLGITWSARPAPLPLLPLRRLRGVALNTAGNPVEGAEVVASASGFGPVGVSDGAGRFAVEVVEPVDRKWIVARAPGYRETRMTPDDVLDRTAAGPLVVELAPARAIVGRLVSARSGAAVQGTVALVRERGWFEFVGEAAMWNSQGQSLLQAVNTEEDGGFRLAAVDEANARLVATAPGHGTVRRKLPEPLPAAVSDRDLGDLVLESEIVLRGRVTDEDGAPVPDARVDFGSALFGTRYVPASAIGGTRNVAADAGGAFRIHGLLPGDDLSLRIQAAGFVTERVSPVRVDGAMDAEEVEVRLRRARELSGRVTDESTGEGVEARVSLRQTVRRGGARTESDPNGEFVLSGFPEGAGVLTVSADGYEIFVRPLAELPEGPLDLVLPPKPEIDVLGVVIRDGAPLAGATVSIRSAASVTDASGRFALKSWPGRASLECRVPGLVRSRRRDIEVSPSLGEITIDVTPIVVRGRVRRPDGAPVPWASVDAAPHDGFEVRHGGGDAETGPDGDFEFQIEPGRYALRARDAGAWGPDVVLPVAVGDEPYVELEAPRSHLLRVRVAGLTAAEADGVVVSLRAVYEEGMTVSAMLVNASGGTDLEPVFETRFNWREGATVTATASAGGRSRRAPVEYAPGDVTDVEISFADGRGAIEGTVTLDGWPLAGESVRIRDDRGNLSWSVLADHRGRFLVDGLRVGDEVSVAAVGQQRAVRVTETRARVDLEATSAAVRGWLFDGETGLPAGGMRVAAVAPRSGGEGEVPARPGRSSTLSAADGSFVLDGLFAAPYRLEVRPGGGSRTSRDVAGSADVDLSSGDVNVTLPVRTLVDR